MTTALLAGIMAVTMTYGQYNAQITHKPVYDKTYWEVVQVVQEDEDISDVALYARWDEDRQTFVGHGFFEFSGSEYNTDHHIDGTTVSFEFDLTDHCDWDVLNRCDWEEVGIDSKVVVPERIMTMEQFQEFY